uniref:C2H2-type domain-containing protein n=1 Tax=Mastacembelus armatus TaxID=205130 RepID=A0A7N8XF79_9TELE
LKGTFLSGSTASLSPFPSLLGSGEDGEENKERGELVEGDKGVAEGGVEVSLDMGTSSVPGPAQQSEQSDHPFQCMDCGKSFRWSSRLTHHQRSHNNERPYRCSLCPKAFKGSSALLYHQRIHTGERPYICSDCGRSFTHSSNLALHSQMHSGLRPFQCTHCNKSFTHSSNLQLHLRTHSSRKDFKCPYCSKEFVMHSYLQRHIRTHGSGVPLPCPGGDSKDGVAVKASVGGITTTTTLLNPITLEASGNNGSLIVSQPALNIPPNTSQNYFMIQTASGLQLIPLSSPTPTPPP